MRKIGIVCRKEIISYISSPMAYIVSAAFLLFCGIFFSSYLSRIGYSETSIKGFFDAGQFLVPLFSIILSMRLIAEEKKTGTWEQLMTSPLTDSAIILGKFLGSLIVVTTMLLLTLYYLLLLAIFGDPDLGPIFSAYLGLFFLGCVSLSIGIFASSLTSNQIVSVVISGAIIFILWFIGSLGNAIPQNLGRILSFFSLFGYYPDFIKGIIDTRAIVYYLSITILFLYVSTLAVERGRWQ